MSSSEKKLLAYVYYRDIPLALSTFISANKNVYYTKDGALKGVGHNCPRLTIRLTPISPDADKKLKDKLDSLLGELESNNQIVSYSVY